VQRATVKISIVPSDPSSPTPTPPISATFSCSRCHRHASTITLLPPGRPDPTAGSVARDPALEAYLATATRLSIDGPINRRHLFLPDMRFDRSKLASAVGSGDPVALFSANQEYAPFWCPTCAASYCGDCWWITEEMDEGFYDYTSGRCPAGHERILDD
jgi:hypothetical protein